jgi:hypothetical protein
MLWAMDTPGCTVVYLHVIDYNQAAMDFYARMGFTRFSKIEGFYPINSVTHDAFVYLQYINGGQPPPEEPPGMLETLWDWLSNTISSLASLALGPSKRNGSPAAAEADEEGEESTENKGQDLV